MKRQNVNSKLDVALRKHQNVSTSGKPGMMLPIVYPTDMAGFFMQFKQWTAENDVIPKDSEVVILEDEEYSYRVSIPKAHISFDMPKNKVEIIENPGVVGV